MPVIQLRSESRYAIAAPVTFWWIVEGGSEAQNGSGVTRDISSRGVSIKAEVCPPKGSFVQVLIHLPQRPGSINASTWEGEGVVVRVEDEGDCSPNRTTVSFAALVHFSHEPSPAPYQVQEGGFEETAKPLIN
jgi:PilZ domain